MPLVQSGIGFKKKFTFIDAPGRREVKVNRTLGTHAPDGRAYEVCPMCSCNASLRSEIREPSGELVDTVWTCENCGYSDSDKLGPLN